jgi:hypothetical protein
MLPSPSAMRQSSSTVSGRPFDTAGMHPARVAPGMAHGRGIASGGTVHSPLFNQN